MVNTKYMLQCHCVIDYRHNDNFTVSLKFNMIIILQFYDGTHKEHAAVSLKFHMKNEEHDIVPLKCHIKKQVSVSSMVHMKNMLQCH